MSSLKPVGNLNHVQRKTPGPLSGRKGIDQGLPESVLVLREGILQPDLFRYPRWLKPAVSAAIKRGDLPKSHLPMYGGWWSLMHITSHLGREWIDHAGLVVQEDGTEIYVSEPYQLLQSGWSQLERFCHVLKLDYQINSRSWWFPSKTIRIEIRRAEDL